MKAMTSQYIRTRLADSELDYTQIAKRHRTRPNYVAYIVHRWAGKESGVPRGLCRTILVDISREIGEAITPAISHLLN